MRNAGSARLATENPSSSFGYTYDPAGNRTSASVNGTQTAKYTYNIANEVQG
jgi:YD repeat-containing protein